LPRSPSATPHGHSMHFVRTKSLKHLSPRLGSTLRRHAGVADTKRGPPLACTSIFKIINLFNILKNIMMTAEEKKAKGKKLRDFVSS
jgi:hypothetical protein